MSKTNTLENSWLLLLFNATAIANIADNAASAALTNLYVSLHTTWPGETGSQSTGEVAYTSYARVAVARNSGGWTVTNNSVSPAAGISFPECTGSTATANFFGIGTTAVAGSPDVTKLLYKGVIGAAPTIVTGATSDTITSPAHGLVVDDPVVLSPVYGLSLPIGITEGTIYYVRTAPDANTFTLATGPGGSPDLSIDITAVGVGAVQKVTPIAITSGVTPTLTTSTTISED